MLEMHAEMLSPITRKLHATGAKVGRLTHSSKFSETDTTESFP